MKAAVLNAPNQLELKNLPDPQPSRDEVVIKVMACGVCPTDVRKFYGRSSCKLPITLGHEIGGVVSMVGDKVQNVKVNDRVTTVADIPCGYCFYCLQNEPNYCLNLKSIGYGTDKIEPLDGGYAQFVKVPAASVLKVPETMSFEDATYVEPLSCAVRTMEIANAQIDECAGVVGDGRMGLLHFQLLRLLGLKQLFMVGIMDDRLALAKKMGAIAINALKDSAAEVISKHVENGLDVIIDTTGDPTAIGNSQTLLGAGGRLILFASSPSGSRVPIDPNLVHYKELTITGAYSNGSRMDWVKAIDLIASGKVDVRSLTSNRLSLDKVAEGFKLIEERKGLRVLIIPNSN